MALSPTREGNIKSVVDEDTYTADKLEAYIDHYIFHSGVRPLQVMINDYVNDAVIKKLQDRYCAVGWQSLGVRHAGDSRGDSYSYFELR